MTFPKLPAIISSEASDEDVLIVRSPAVGLYSLAPELGSYLTGGSSAGRLKVLHRTHELVLPANAWGWVRRLVVEGKVTPVEYGQALFQLQRGGLDRLAGEGVQQGPVVEQALVEDTHPILSPTDGVFYLKPNPTAAPYVRVGDRIVQGQTLGLVEVMKCFNPIQYDGPGLPPEAEIVEICAADGAEIKSGQILFLVR